VDRSHASAAPGLGSPVTEAGTRDLSDPTRYHDLILFLDEGWLKTLEIVHYAGPAPDEYPPPDDVEPPWVRSE
jgi:hypothetical protein